MTPDDELKLAELLCARLCHDLSGPIGGAAAGAELLADEDPPDADTAQLVADSVAAATRLLRLLRAALGSGSQPFAAAELEALLRAACPESGAIALDWSGQPAAAGWDRGAGKLILNLLMMARDALPRGGRIALAAAAAPFHLELSASGPLIVADDLAAALAAASVSGLSARAAQGFYAARLADRSGCRVTLDHVPGHLTVRIT